MVFNVVVSYCCERKMLKRNRRNNRLFVTFLSLVKFQLGRSPGPLPPPPPPLATPTLQLRRTKKCLQIFREVSGVFQQNFTGLKNSAVLESRTVLFSRT